MYVCIYQNFRFGVANEVLKYADMSSAEGSIQGPKTSSKEEKVRIY